MLFYQLADEFGLQRIVELYEIGCLAAHGRAVVDEFDDQSFVLRINLTHCSHPACSLKRIEATSRQKWCPSRIWSPGLLYRRAFP